MDRRTTTGTARWAGAALVTIAALLAPVASSGAQTADVVTIEVEPRHPVVGGSISVSGTCQGRVVVVSLGTTSRPTIVVTPSLTVDADTHAYATDLDLPPDLPNGFTATATCGSDPDTALGTASLVVTYVDPATTSTSAPGATVAPAVSGAPSFTG